MLIPNQPTISTYCANTGCVEVTLDDQVQVRDTKDDGEKTMFDVSAWRAFVAALNTGQFDG